MQVFLKSTTPIYYTAIFSCWVRKTPDNQSAITTYNINRRSQECLVHGKNVHHLYWLFEYQEDICLMSWIKSWIFNVLVPGKIEHPLYWLLYKYWEKICLRSLVFLSPFVEIRVKVKVSLGLLLIMYNFLTNQWFVSMSEYYWMTVCF